MDALKVLDLTKKFGPKHNPFVAVNRISFSLKEGEILGFLGRNGAGKTTTIQMLLGIMTPTSGEIYYFDQDFKTNREQIMEHVNFSSTYTNLPWDLTVHENLTFISYLYQIKDRKNRIRKIVENFKIEKLVNQKLSELSTGQLTRVNLAKSFINKPRVLLLDEPTASLDPETADMVRKILLKEAKASIAPDGLIMLASLGFWTGPGEINFTHSSNFEVSPVPNRPAQFTTSLPMITAVRECTIQVTWANV